jgi:hypothetical protein
VGILALALLGLGVFYIRRRMIRRERQKIPSFQAQLTEVTYGKSDQNRDLSPSELETAPNTGTLSKESRGPVFGSVTARREIADVKREHIRHHSFIAELPGSPVAHYFEADSNPVVEIDSNSQQTAVRDSFVSALSDTGGMYGGRDDRSRLNRMQELREMEDELNEEAMGERRRAGSRR